MTIKVTYNVTDVYMSQSVSPVYINVSYSDGGASGGGVWGTITGTLSNQTDLQTALDLKLDESTIDGGGEGQILSKASATDFDFAWINNYAKYLATNVRNQTGSTIDAFQVVYISGATGNKPLISLADADTEATSSKTYGVTATEIANNGTGDVVTAGELSGINTSAFNEGDLLWLSTTAGGVVTTPPAEPAHAVFIGYVVRSHPTLGVIDVSIQNGYELNELHGVQITTPTDNQGLFYNSTSTLWENKSITTALGYTPVPTTRNITINGVTYDLSADRTYTISTGISGSGASGQVTYWTGASAVSGSSLFTWDNTSRILQLSGADITQIINQTNTTLASAIGFRENGSTKGYIQYVGSAFSIANRQQLLEIQGNAGLAFRTGTEAARFFSNGNLAINSTSDLGVRLGVVGDTLLRGSGNTSSTTALTVQNSDSANLFRVLNNGQINLGNSASFPYIRTVVSDFTQTPTGTKVIFGTQDTTTGNGSFLFGSNTLSHTTGTVTYVQLLRDFTPTSGTGSTTHLLLNGTINQTGGANGITRGLYVNPTLTAAADFRSIEWSNNSGWGLYGAGTANNYIAGSLGIGSTVNLSSRTLSIVKNITGAITAYSVVNDGQVQSDVTGNATGFFNGINTQNAAFTLANYMHFDAQQGTIGASSTVTNQYGFRAASSLTTGTNIFGFRGDIASGTGRWNLYMNGTADNYLAGNLGIGITPTVKLHVSGDTILRGSGATSATTALTVQNSSSTNLFRVFNNGAIVGTSGIYTGTAGSSTNGIAACNTSDASLTPITSQFDIGVRFSDFRTSTNAGYSYWFISQQYTNLDYTSGTGGFINISRGFAPTSGTGVFNSLILQNTINQTGGANGITRGLYVNPTLTSAADFRAIEVSAGITVLAPSVTARASLRIPSGTAPTSPNDGDIWFDGTDIKMRIGGVTKTFTLI